MTAGSSEIQSGFINALTMGSKVLTPGSMPTQVMLEEALSSVTAGVSLNAAALALGGLAVAGTAYGLYKGYEAIEAHYTAEAEQYQLFEQDCEQNVANFFLLSKKPTGSQRFFKAVIDLLQDGKGNLGHLYRLANIHYKEVTSADPRVGYAIMNMASFSFVTNPHFAEGENEALDHARNGMDDFLQALPQRLLRKLTSVKTNRLSLLLTPGHLTSKEIQHLNLVRFMTMVFINISLNLKYPPDLSTQANIPLDDRAASALCGTVMELIDKLVAPDDKDKKFEYLERIQCKDEFLEFLTDLKQRIQKIQAGYQSKLLRQLNIGAVVVSSRELLKSVNESITHTLFLGSSDATNINLLCLVEELAGDFEGLTDVWTTVASAYRTKQLPVIPGLNNPPRTVIDLIGLFASYDAAGRATLYTHLKKLVPELAASLGRLDSYFLAPFDKHFVEVNKQETPTKKQTLDKTHPVVFQKNAATAYLMSLIALVVESSPRVLEDALHQQLVTLNQMQSQASEPVLFSLNIFDQLGFKEVTLTKIKLMLENERKFIDALRTEIVLEKLLKTNKNLLMDLRVRAIIKKVGMTLQQAAQAWSGSVQDLSIFIDTKRDIVTNEHRHRYFGHMLHESKGLTHRFELLRLLIEDTMRVIDSPEFTNALAGEMTSTVAAIYASHDASQDDRDYIMGLLMATWSRENSSGAPASTVSNSGLSSTAVLSVSTVGGGVRNPVAVPSTSLNLPIAGDTSQLVDVPATPPNSLETQSDDSSVFMLQTVLCILKAVSAFLLIVGVLALLSLTLGVPYLPIIAALTSQQATGYMVAACVGIATGTVGLAVPVFFKPKASEADEELDADPEEQTSCWMSCSA